MLHKFMSKKIKVEEVGKKKGGTTFKDSTEGWTNKIFFFTNKTNPMCNRWCPLKCRAMYYVLMWVNIPGSRIYARWRENKFGQKRTWNTVCTQSNALISIFSQPQDCICWCQMCFVEAHDRHTSPCGRLVWSLGNHKDFNDRNRVDENKQRNDRFALKPEPVL